MQLYEIHILIISHFQLASSYPSVIDIIIFLIMEVEMQAIPMYRFEENVCTVN